MSSARLSLWLMLLSLLENPAWFGFAGAAPLAFRPAPVDNPLKGLVPYVNAAGTNFPCSMEFSYLPLKRLVAGPGRYEWNALETLLDAIAGRGRQAVIRFHLEYPGQPSAVPDYLVELGISVTTWTNPESGRVSHTPDYADVRVRACLTNFIGALGAKYDGDPRLGYITAGLLGSWGEWHTHPRADLYAGKEVEQEVMDAYEAAFKQTPILLRYPAGEGHRTHSSNAKRRFGFHDDSFAYATLDDGRKGHDWYFQALMGRAGALEAWRTRPIGGEVRPEVWGCCYDEPGCEPEGQSFADCVEKTHVTWLMDSGIFGRRYRPERAAKAARLVRRMGYEFHVSEAETEHAPGKALAVRVRVNNRGVAPFYQKWPIELAAVGEGGRAAASWRTAWDITQVPPGSDGARWSHTVNNAGLAAGNYHVLMRVVNPLVGGRALSFANETQDSVLPGWLTLGAVQF